MPVPYYIWNSRWLYLDDLTKKIGECEQSKHSLYDPTLQRCCHGFGLLFCSVLLKLKLSKKRETGTIHSRINTIILLSNPAFISYSALVRAGLKLVFHAFKERCWKKKLDLIYSVWTSASILKRNICASPVLRKSKDHQNGYRSFSSCHAIKK